jgi:cellulose synthase/poly-beta-1,6-N-acetylglucosamine synthase-like glycosyltransferase
MTSLPSRAIHRGEVAVIVPARNEREQIGSTLLALQNQTRPSNKIIVVANNCTDDTAEIALACGVIVLEMPCNTDQKAGALNYGIDHLLGDSCESSIPEFILTIDADTVLDPRFIELSVNILNYDENLGGVSAVCRGKSGLGTTVWQKVLAWFQAAEYARASRTRLRADIHTMSGAGSLLRIEAILDVIHDRGVFYRIPSSKVEDFETTLATKEFGWKCANNFHCAAYTDLMLSIPALLKQRIRWVSGTIDELRLRGWRPETRLSILSLTSATIILPLFYLFWYLLIARTVATHSVSNPTLVYLGILGAYQAFTARDLGWKGMIVCFLLLPELLFTPLKHAWFIASVAQSFGPTTNQEWSQ